MKIREGKRYIAWLYICFMAALFSSCQFVNDYRTIRSMKRSTIVFPEEMLVMRNHDLSFGHPNCDSLLFIVYFDSGDDCLPCVTTHLPDLNELNSYLAALGVKFSLIITPDEENYSTLIDDIRRPHISYPLFVDSDKFFKNNNAIPKDEKFHGFLLDVINVPIYVGNPLHSAEFERFLSINKP